MACEHCVNGWLIVKRNDYSAAERCPCSIPPPRIANPKAETPLSRAYIDASVARLGNLKFFPKDPGALTGIAEMIERMVRSEEQLSWLVRTMIDRVGVWHGPMEMRGVFCTRFRTADGIESDCVETPGFMPDEREMLYLTAGHRDVKRIEQLPAPSTKLLYGEIAAAAEDAGESAMAKLLEESKPAWAKREEQKKLSLFAQPAPPIDRQDVTEDDIQHARAQNRLSKGEPGLSKGGPGRLGRDPIEELT